MNSKVNETFKNGNLADNSFVNAMKKLNKRTAILGLAIGAITGAALQPINVYIPERKPVKNRFRRR